ncbi:MAG TPA: hypothetical protein VJK05_02010 [archaeon]|nr:hypothetical protein [archaeon]
MGFRRKTKRLAEGILNFFRSKSNKGDSQRELKRVSFNPRNSKKYYFDFFNEWKKNQLSLLAKEISEEEIKGKEGKADLNVKNLQFKWAVINLCSIGASKKEIEKKIINVAKKVKESNDFEAEKIEAELREIEMMLDPHSFFENN